MRKPVFWVSDQVQLEACNFRFILRSYCTGVTPVLVNLHYMIFNVQHHLAIVNVLSKSQTLNSREDVAKSTDQVRICRLDVRDFAAMFGHVISLYRKFVYNS